MELPLVTIYITNYNYSQFLEQSIESVNKQTYKNIELLIIDDGSTDGSHNIIEKYRHQPNTNIIYQKNKGLNVTNNIAMRSAKGKYIMRLDADDYLAKNAVEEMCLILEQDPEIGLIFPDYYYVNSNGEIIGEERRHNFNKDVSLYDQPAHGACTLIRLEFLKELGGYNESFMCQDGYDLWIKFIIHHKVSNINKPLFYYRRHGNNLTSNEEKILNTRKKIKDLHIENHYIDTPSCIAVIPLRSKIINGINWPLFEFNGESILEKIVGQINETTKVNHIVITSSEDKLLNYSIDKFERLDNVSIIERPNEYARYNETLSKTFIHIIEQLKQKKVSSETILSIALEYPFINTDLIEDAINTLTIFNADSLLSVRPDNRMYYQHLGHGMVPILNQDRFTKLEREALYKGAGGIMISKTKTLLENGKPISGKVSHIVVDEKASFGVFSEFDFKLYKLLINQNETVNR